MVETNLEFTGSRTSAEPLGTERHPIVGNETLERDFRQASGTVAERDFNPGS